MDQRYRNMSGYLIDGAWRKKEIIALTAEKSGVSERTARNWLTHLEEEGFVETVEVSRNRVFVKRDSNREFPFDFEIRNEAAVHSALERSHQHIDDLIHQTFPFKLRDDDASHSVLRSYINQIRSRFQNNEIPRKELKKLEEAVQELDDFCLNQFVVVYDELYIDYIFNILDNLIFLWENYEKIEIREHFKDFLTVTVDPTDMSQMYLSFLNNVSLNASIVGCGEAYSSRLSERLPQLQPLIETAPDPVATQIYYLIQSHGSVAQRINAFIDKIRSQDDSRHTQFIDDAYSFYDDKERKRLQTRLRDIADDLDQQQRTLLERVCIELNRRRDISHDEINIRYYNKTKEKILAVLAHGPKKLESIARYAGEGKSNIHTNIETLSEHGIVRTVEDRRGYYTLGDDAEGLFENRKSQQPVAERSEVKKALRQIAGQRDEHVYTEGVQVYDEDEQRVQDPPWHTLFNLVWDRSFVLEKSEEMNLFFDILDRDLEAIQRTDTRWISTPDEIIFVWVIAGFLYKKWKDGLENIRYHSELSSRIDDLKQVHGCVSASERKDIRSLVSIVDFDKADALFKQAVSEKKEEKKEIENIEDLKKSIRDIYQYNDQMHTVVSYLSSNQERSSVGGDELQAELLKYAVNLPYESLDVS